VAAADGVPPLSDSDIPVLSAQQYADIGVDVGAAASVGANLKLLNDAVGRKGSSGVDTVKEIENLARIANAIQAIAGGADVLSLTPALTPTDFQTLGVTGVTTDNLASVLTQIGKKTDDGSATDTIAELNALVSATQAALTLIQNFAQANASSEGWPDDGDSSQYTGDATLTAQVFADAGISGVTAGNLRSIKDALATPGIGAAQVRTQSAIQAVVDTYNAIRTAADGSPSASDADIAGLTSSQYAAIGLDATWVAMLGDVQNLKLLNDAVSGRSVTAVDTVNELNNLARIVKAIQDVAAGTDPTHLTPALTVADFIALGIQGVSNGNLKAVLTGIGAAADDGSASDTIAQLDAIVANAQNQLSALSTYADLNGGTVPTTTTYQEAGVTGVRERFSGPIQPPLRVDRCHRTRL